MAKYELDLTTATDFDGITLYRIRCIKAFSDIEVGEFGGWVESEENLSQDGNAWVSEDARVSGNAWVYGNARVYGDAWVYGNAEVYGNAWVYGNARVYGDAWVYGNARVHGDARVYGEVSKSSDYIILKNNLTSQRYYTYLFPEDIWVIGCFKGTTKELQEHLLEKGNELQKLEYSMAIEYVTKLREVKTK